MSQFHKFAEFFKAIFTVLLKIICRWLQQIADSLKKIGLVGTLVWTRVVQKNIFLKSDAANGFSRCITPKNDIFNFHKQILMFKGCATRF